MFAGGSKSNGPINVDIVARKVICRYVCQTIIWNASAVVQIVSPHSNYLWNITKWGNVDNKSNT